MSVRRVRQFVLATVTAVVLTLVASGVAVRAAGDLFLTPLGGDVTPTYLAQLLLGDTGAELLNATYTGDPSAAGMFFGGTGIFESATRDEQPLENGIVLSSGRVVDAKGPNKLTNTTGSFCIPDQQNNCIPNGDPDLSKLVGAPTYDAAVLEMDFVPPQETNVVTFRYAFTSEEYNEFANSPFNNVFGFYVNGVNYALLPDGITTVSINNVNGGSPFGTDPHNPEFFRNNEGTIDGTQVSDAPINIEADGLTVILTFRAPIIPGRVNRLKLAIADTGDHVLDSWTFLERASFSENQEICDNDIDDDADGFVDEGCTTTSEGQLFEVPNTPEEAVEHTFEFPGLGDIDDTNKTPLLKLTERTTLRPHTLKVLATVLDPRDLLLPLKNPLVFPFGTTCLPAKTKTPGSLKPCIFYEVVDAVTNLPPIEGVDYLKAPGAIRWELDYEVLQPINGSVGMGHFRSDMVQEPVDLVDENIILEYHSGIGESDNYSGTVLTVSPTGGPSLTLPAGIVAEAEGPAGAQVDYVTSATGTVIVLGTPIQQTLAVTCDKPSGSVFALGDTTVTCSTTDGQSPAQTTTGSFVVSVVDTTGPTLVQPNIPPQQATGPSGAAVSFTVHAQDLVDGDILVTAGCSPSSGSTFAIGTTSVSCSFTDSHGNPGAGSFPVTVVDTLAPVLNMPSGIQVPAKNASGAPVTFTVTATDAVDGPVTATCTPTSGSTFPIGTTQVQCKAKDSRENQVTGQFPVTVGCCDVKITAGPAHVNRGQNVTLNITATNFSKKFIYGIVVFEYTSPCSHGLVGAAPAILLPGAKFSLTAIFKVPRFACTGTYTFSTLGIFVDGSTTSYSTSVVVH